MPDITFNCPSCGQKIEAPAELAGAEASCPTCQGKLLVPFESDSPPAVSAPVPVAAFVPPASPLAVADRAGHPPHFIAAKCPSCGGDLQVPDNREQVKCMYCGGTVIIRQAIQLASGVNVPNLMALAKSALGAQNHKEAYDYYTKVLEYDPRNSEAWFGKGESAGWMSTVAQLRTQEMIAALTNAINYAAASDKAAWQRRCGESITAVSAACYSVSRKHLEEFSQLNAVWTTYMANCAAVLAALNAGLAFFPQNKAALELTVCVCVDLLESAATDWATIWRRDLDNPFGLTGAYQAQLRNLVDESAAKITLIDPSFVKPRL